MAGSTNRVSPVQTAKAGGIEMKYITMGTGSKTFVVFPGLSIFPVTGAGEIMADIFADFLNDFTVYLFDVREDIGPGITIKDLADANAAIMKSLGISKACICGASMGGMEAMSLAADYPELVEKLIINSSTCATDPAFAKNAEAWMKYAKEGPMRELFRVMFEAMYTKRTLDERGEAMYAGCDLVTPDMCERLIYLIKAIMNPCLEDKVKNIKCPVLVIGAMGDKVFSTDSFRKLAETTNGELILYGEEYGHSVYDEAPGYYRKVYDYCMK